MASPLPPVLGCLYTKNTLGPNNLLPKQSACNFGERGRRPAKNGQVRAALVCSRARPVGQGHGGSCLGSKSKHLLPLNSPAPRVTRVRPPRATASPGSQQTPGSPLSCKCGPAPGSPALPVARLWTRVAEGRALPLAPRSQAAARDAARKTGVCHRSPGPGPVGHERRGAARRSPALGLPPPRPGAQRSNSRRSCRVPAGQEGWERKTPISLFLDALSFPPELIFPFARRTPVTGRGGGRAPLPAPCGLTHRFLTDRLVFSLFSLSSLPLKPSPERRRDVSDGHRGQRATESFLSVAPGAGRRRRPETPRGQARQDAAPHPVLPPHSSVPCDAHRAPGPGRPWRSAGAAARAGESPGFLTGSASSSSASRAPATSGLCVPSAAGVHPGLEFWERRTERASPRMASPLWAASPGGPHGSSPPKFVCPVRKAFPLQSTKAKRPGRALKSPGLGRGWPEAREHGGGAGLRTEKVARPG